MEEFNAVLRLLEKAAAFGKRTTSMGATLLGHLPHVAPEAWFHKTYRGLSENRILELEFKIKKKLPATFREFLSLSNGINIFSGHLAIYGVRENFSRIGDAVWQPFSIETPNTLERPKGVSDSCIFIGGYFDDGSQLVIDTDNSKIYRLPQRKASPVLTEWPDFWTMLNSEAQRLAAFFDSSGRLLDEECSTAPP